MGESWGGIPLHCSTTQFDVTSSMLFLYDTQTTIEMHMHEHPFWHVVHNKRNRLDAYYDQNAK